jgi:hypothetical protein
MPALVTILWPLLAAAVALGADYASRRLHVTMLAATTASVVAFGVAGVASARSAGDFRRARVAVLAGAALFAAGRFTWLVSTGATRPAAAVAALLDFGFAAMSGVLGVAREARRAQKR